MLEPQASDGRHTTPEEAVHALPQHALSSLHAGNRLRMRISKRDSHTIVVYNRCCSPDDPTTPLIPLSQPGVILRMHPRYPDTSFSGRMRALHEDWDRRHAAGVRTVATDAQGTTL